MAKGCLEYGLDSDTERGGGLEVTVEAGVATLVNRLPQCAPMGATSQAGVMTAEWTSKTLSALSAFLLSRSRRNRPTQQKHNHPAKSFSMKAASLC